MQQLMVRDLWGKNDWKQRNSLLVVQTGESVDQAKVFKAHAVQHGLCENLINAQQKDGDGLTQSIVTNLCEGSRKGFMHGLREFVKSDNQRAFEVGYLSEGMGKFKVRRPKGSGDGQEEPR